MKASITIFGSCVTDNTFYYAAVKKKNAFLIKNRFFQINPLAIADDNVISCLTDIEPIAKWAYAVQSIKTQFNKNFSKRLKQQPSDYIVIDFLACEYDLLEIKLEEGTTYLSLLWEMMRNYDMIDKILTENNIPHQVKKASQIDSNVQKNAIKQFADIILEYFSPDKIILIETQSATYGEKNQIGTLEPIAGYIALNATKREALNEFMQYVPGCHIIHTPDLVYGTYKHFLGLHHNHFEEFYYDYLYKSVDIITDNLDHLEELKLLEKERKECSIKYTDLFEKKLFDTFHNMFYGSPEYNVINICKKDTFLESIRNYHNITDNYIAFESNHTELNGYITDLIDSQRKVILFMSVSDSADRYWNKFTAKDLLNIKTDISNKFRQSYIAVIDIENNKTIEICNHTDKILQYNGSFYIPNTEIQDNTGNSYSYFVFKIISQAYYQKYHCSRILINNVDYSINKRGLNIVVFDKSYKCVIDSFNVDMFGDSELRIIRQ